MSKAIATCGHEVNYSNARECHGYLVCANGETRKGEYCEDYKVLCTKCYREHLRDKRIKKVYIKGKWEDI